MNWQIWFVTLARISAQALGVAGQTALANVFTKIGDIGQANENVEEHMKLVQDNLDSGPIDSTDWNSVEARITAKQDRIDRV